MSVTEPADLRTGELPASVSGMAYPSAAKPVFFGHYWLTGTPVLQAKNALCLDYSAGKEGPLMSYLMDGDAPLSLKHLQNHAA